MNDALLTFWRGCEGPIRFGINDCCMVVADTIVAAGGPDLMDVYRGHYSTELGFMRLVRKAGFETVAAAAEGMLSAKGEQIPFPENFSVAVINYGDGQDVSRSPAFFFDGFWNLRTVGGQASFRHIDWTGQRIYRVL